MLVFPCKCSCACSHAYVSIDSLLQHVSLFNIFRENKYGGSPKFSTRDQNHGAGLTTEAQRDAAAIKRFQSSHNTFIAFCVVCILVEFAFVVMYPAAFVPSLPLMAGHLVNAIFRWRCTTFGELRWLFGWIMVFVVLLATLLSVLMWSPDIKVGPVAEVEVAITLMAGHLVLQFWFLNFSGTPAPCRMTIMFVLCYACAQHSLPIVWSNGRDCTAIIAAMLLGDLTGRLWVQRNAGSNAVTKEVSGRDWDISSIAFPNVCILAFAHRCHSLLDDQPDTTVVCGAAVRWLIIFVHLHVAGVPQLVRWMMLSILYFCMSLFVPKVLLMFVGVLAVGEVVWLLWVYLYRTKQAAYRCTSKFEHDAHE